VGSYSHSLFVTGGRIMNLQQIQNGYLSQSHFKQIIQLKQLQDESSSSEIVRGKDGLKVGIDLNSNKLNILTIVFSDFRQPVQFSCERLFELITKNKKYKQLSSTDKNYLYCFELFLLKEFKKLIEGGELKTLVIGNLTNKPEKSLLNTIGSIFTGELKKEFPELKLITIAEFETSHLDFFSETPLEFGHRVDRRFYSNSGIFLDADVNAAYNILRRGCPDFNCSRREARFEQ
jgi:hypothetical protein